MKRILLVDDDTDLLISLKTVLRKQGYEVTTTTSCTEGLTIFYSVQPDLVLLDVNVGDEDGRSMCRQIKTKAESQHIPVILISANEEQLRSYHEYGADASLPKPFDLTHLLDLVKKILAKHIG